MRITPETLRKLAQDTAVQRARSDLSIVSVYLHGSLLGEDALLGGAADIDLFFVHNDEIGPQREIVRVTDDVHLDLAHHSKKLYRQARELRLHPWLGPTLYGCKILYDPQHFLDFVQASVRGQYDRPDHVMDRSRPPLVQARQIWFSFSSDVQISEVQVVSNYLQALFLSAQSVALLQGATPTMRRFLLQFAEYTKALQSPHLFRGFMELLHGTVEIDDELVGAWSAQWTDAFQAAASSGADPRFSLARHGYYRRAFDALYAGQQPLSILWPLLNTWTQLIAPLPVDAPAYLAWRQAMTTIGLLGDVFPERLDALDKFLDAVEDTLDDWARKNGA